MKKIVILVISIMISSYSYGQFSLKDLKKTVTTATSSATLSESDIAKGLKEALTVGAKNASSQLNAVDGFNKNMKVRIPFPEDAQRVANKLREMGFGKKVDEFEQTLNRAAEQAAKEAAPIFVNAITSMSITDAKNILMGADTSATSYLRTKTSDPLVTAFSPHIQKALNTTTATKKWTELATLYNRIPLVKKVETDLVKYTTSKALKGLFTVVAEEEIKIRKDPAARVTDLLKKVFGSTNG
jgi:chemotaxis protein CheY-P-specific phosphatase CheC